MQANHYNYLRRSLDSAEFADCATGRTVSVAWACRSQYKEVQNCMRSIQGEEAMIQRRKQFLQDKRDAKANAERI